MLQIADLTEYTERDIPGLIDRVRPILLKRQQLHEKYSRGADDKTLLYSNSNLCTKLPFEKFITDLATGYTAGAPTYTVNLSKNEKKNRILEEILDKRIIDADYAERMKVIIDFIADYNDDAQENYDLFHDIFELTSCYELIYENEHNEIVYSRFSPLQTVATWDYSIPANLTGLVRIWEEKNIQGEPVTKVELTDKNGSRIYNYFNKLASVERINNFNWGDVPACAVETDYSIFETCEDVINAYEQLVQNVRNTYQYNDSDCKLIFEGYTPENELTITETVNGKTVVRPNPARMAEDEAWIKSRTIYVGENGKVNWLSKPVDATGVDTILKTYIDLMFQLAGIPNTSDLAFNSTDLNASAIDRKFYIMNMAISSAVSMMKKANLRRWELIFNRINLKKSTTFDFRDIKVELPKNLPNNDDEMIKSLMQLEGRVSNQTILEKLGYDYDSEKVKLEEEASDSILQNIKIQKEMAEINDGTGQTTNTEATLASNGQANGASGTEVQENI